MQLKPPYTRLRPRVVCMALGSGFCVGRDCDVGGLWVCAEARHLTFLGLDDRSSLGGPSALAGRLTERQDNFYSACSVCYKKRRKK